MKFLRIIIVVLVIILFSWLNWWVLPDLAIVHFSKMGEPIPDTGLILISETNSKFDGYRVIDRLDLGWSGVPAAWPYMLAGIILGIVAGFFSGDQSRRILAIDSASKEALEEAERLSEEAQLLSDMARCEMAKISKREQDVVARMEYLKKTQLQDQEKREEFEKQKEQWTGKHRRTETMAKELKNAKDKIRRLEDKIYKMELKEMELKLIDEF
ncbi:MAG: hypothetical protein PHD01_01965 [Geobacteraceae bacterium]|nr:hypothetical protein [Geobacteraceae bacterium]